MAQVSPLTIYRARWVVPVSGPPLEAGAVCCYEDAIVEVGPAGEVLASRSGRVVDLGDGVLMPALVNCHSHLELSFLKWRMEPSGSFTGWVRRLMELRGQAEIQEVLGAAQEGLEEMASSGIGACHDVGNSLVLATLADKLSQEGVDQPLERAISALELIAPLEAEAPRVLPMLNRAPQLHGKGAVAASFSAHAGFTLAPSLIKAVKEWTKRHRLPFSIHAAESPEEMEFFADRSGPMVELLRERGHWPLDWRPAGPTPVAHLHRLGVLDPSTILVHCCHLDRSDLELMAGHGVSACLCPRSNTFIGVGRPEVEELFRAGVRVCLGTDSLASNDRLSLWHEMAALASWAPGLPPERLLEAATLNGAKALGMEGAIGSLAPGRSARMVLVTGDGVPSRPRELLEWLVHAPARDQAQVEVIR